MKISLRLTYFSVVTSLLFFSCSTDDDIIDPDPGQELTVPSTYVFERGGQNTVRIPGQMERIRMGEEIIEAFLDFDALDANTALLDNMFMNENNAFIEAALNSSSRQIRNTVASSED